MDRIRFKSVLLSNQSCLEDIDKPESVRKDITAAVWQSKGHLWDIFHILNCINEYMRPGSLILDFGCGHGFFSALMATDEYKVLHDLTEKRERVLRSVGLAFYVSSLRGGDFCYYDFRAPD